MLIEDWQFFTIIFLAGLYVARDEYKHRLIWIVIKKIATKVGCDISMFERKI